MKKIKMISAYTILFLIILIVAVLTWIIPAGTYDYNSLNQPIPGTYHTVDRNTQTLSDVLLAPFEGFYSAVDIAVFILMVGGFLGIVLKTGALDAGISHVVTKLNGNEKYMIPVLMILFGLGGTTFGMAEETFVFYPLLIPVFISAGYDSVTAVAVILLGSSAGVLGSTVNPFATGIASNFAGVSLGDGILIRIITLIVVEGACIYFTMQYASKIKKNPEKSIIHNMHNDDKDLYCHNCNDTKAILTTEKKTVLILFALTFLIMIYAVIPFNDLGISFIPTLGWWFDKLSVLFLVSALVIGVYCKMNEATIIESFLSGAADLLGVAFIIGISRGITVVMNDGMITDTLLHWGETALSNSGSVLFIILTYLFYIPLSFLIPSTSGLATLTMPVMAPLGDFAGVDSNLIVTAYQLASGIVNFITPTSAVVMGALSFGRIPFDRWIKLVWRLILFIFIISIVILSIGVRI